jgi:uncharacterized protein YbaR (Trm112 family)
MHDIICCFCGRVIKEEELLTIQVYTTDDPNAIQELYSHKKCLAVRITDEVPILFDED